MPFLCKHFKVRQHINFVYWAPDKGFPWCFITLIFHANSWYIPFRKSDVFELLSNPFSLVLPKPPRWVFTTSAVWVSLKFLPKICCFTKVYFWPPPLPVLISFHSYKSWIRLRLTKLCCQRLQHCLRFLWALQIHQVQLKLLQIHLFNLSFGTLKWLSEDDHPPGEISKWIANFRCPKQRPVYTLNFIVLHCRTTAACPTCSCSQSKIFPNPACLLCSSPLSQ